MRCRGQRVGAEEGDEDSGSAGAEGEMGCRVQQGDEGSRCGRAGSDRGGVRVCSAVQVRCHMVEGAHDNLHLNPA